MKVYYAHCMGLYGTKQEQRDLVTLMALGFEVTNPNDPEVEAECRLIRERTFASPSGGDPGAAVMEYFRKFAISCDAIAFRALPDGAIPAGVAKEIAMFREQGKPVIELPSAVVRRTISVEGTREYLGEVGFR